MTAEFENRPWIKLWARWYESTSHALLSPHALHTGPHLLIIASRHGIAGDSAYLVGPNGDPLSFGDLARLTRWPPKNIAKIVAELIQCQTMAVETDRGTVHLFPNFRRWQESPSAARVRKHRERKGNVTSADNIAVTVTAEDRGQKTEDRVTTPLPPQAGEAPKRRPKAKYTEAETAQADQVIERINERKRAIIAKFGGTYQPFRATQTNRREVIRLLRDGELIETVLAVVDSEAREVWRRRGEGLEWLNPVTPFRAANWPVRLARVGRPDVAGSATSTAVVCTLDEALAHLAANGKPPQGWVYDADANLVPEHGA